MTLKHYLAVMLALLLLVGMAPELLPAALAEASTNGCPNSSDGKHDWSEWRQTKTPTCTEKGQSMRVCYRCKKQETKEIPALGHNWSEWRTTKEASCTEKGVRKRECLRCDLQDRQEIDYAHQWGAWEPDLPGTCIQKERLVRKCKKCGALDYWTKDYGDHDWDEWETVKAPTATQSGEEKRVCKNTPNHVETREIPATGGNPEEKKPGLTIVWTYDNIYHDDSKYATTEPGVLGKTDGAYAHYTVSNTGSVPLIVIAYCTYGDGHTVTAPIDHSAAMNPGNSADDYFGKRPLIDNATPGSATEDLLGTMTVSFYCVGYDPETFVSTDNPGKELCRTETITRTWKIGKDDGPHPNAFLEVTWAEDEGVGKRYEGAPITTHWKITNTGDCDILVTLTNKWLKPGESAKYDRSDAVNTHEVEVGYYGWLASVIYGYYDGDNLKWGDTNSKRIEIPLTYPDGDEPEEKKPELKVTWVCDGVWHDGHINTTLAPGVLDPEDDIAAYFKITNTGNIVLNVDSFVTYGNGDSKSWSSVGMKKSPLSPGKYEGPSKCVWGSSKISEVITPGTATEELLGTASVTIWAIGYDPETGEELCKSNEITRTWKVGKDSPWEIPEDSKLEGRLEVRPGYESSDPAGYVLGEPVSTVLYVKNTGLVDLDSFTVNDPWDGSTFTDGPIAVGEEKSYVRADTTVQPEDVERGYIDYPAIQITWIDPDSEKERPTVAGPLHLNVLSKTGLLLKKDVAFQPANGEYFQEGEPIQWKLTVTNNSEDPVTDVTVEDKGVNVGSYAQIDPGDTENCTVPVHVVTEYDAKVVGYVLNSATATGIDNRGATKTWSSNVAKAITKQVDPDGDPKGDPEGLHPAVTIVKAEAHGPLNGSFYEAGEPIDYVITIKNTGDTEIKDIAVTDSLAGLAPIGTLASLAPGDGKSFNYAYTVKEEDLPYQWVYNTAVITYVFGENVKGTPKASNTVQSKVGDIDLPIPPHLDPDLTPTGDDFCTLTLDALGDAEANYTLHACEDHLGAAIAAEEAAESGDWAKAAELWRAEVEALYEVLYAAADGQLKSALIAERAAYYDYIEGLEALSEQAAANELRLKCAFLCCALHTTPEDLPSSLAGEYARMVGWEEQAESARVIGALTGSDSAVTETYVGFAAYAQKNVIDLMNSEKSWYWDDVFARGVQLWQVALDNSVNPVYKAADKDTRKLIAGWRISLDTLYTAEKDFIALLYEGNDEAIQEALMNLYKDAALTAGYLK